MGGSWVPEGWPSSLGRTYHGAGRDPRATEAHMRQLPGSGLPPLAAPCSVLGTHGPGLSPSYPRGILPCGVAVLSVKFHGCGGRTLQSAVLSGRVGVRRVSWDTHGFPRHLLHCGRFSRLFLYFFPPPHEWAHCRWGLQRFVWSLLAGDGTVDSRSPVAACGNGAESGWGGRECQLCPVRLVPRRGLRGHRCNTDCGFLSIHL